MKLDVEFSIGTKVIIDNDTSLPVIVIGIAWFGKRIEYQCAWFHSGDSKQDWISEFRLTRARD